MQPKAVPRSLGTPFPVIILYLYLYYRVLGFGGRGGGGGSPQRHLCVEDGLNAQKVICLDKVPSAKQFL